MLRVLEVHACTNACAIYVCTGSVTGAHAREPRSYGTQLCVSASSVFSGVSVYGLGVPLCMCYTGCRHALICVCLNVRRQRVQGSGLLILGVYEHV